MVFRTLFFAFFFFFFFFFAHHARAVGRNLCTLYLVYLLSIFPNKVCPSRSWISKCCCRILKTKVYPGFHNVKFFSAKPPAFQRSLTLSTSWRVQGIKMAPLFSMQPLIFGDSGSVPFSSYKKTGGSIRKKWYVNGKMVCARTRYVLFSRLFSFWRNRRKTREDRAIVIFYQILLSLHLSKREFISLLVVYLYVRIWFTAWQNQQNNPCAHQRFRSASLISLRCPHEETLGPSLPIERTAKTL